MPVGQVRLSPVGKTYVQYAVRSSPFVSKLCEVTLSRAEIANLRAKAKGAADLEDKVARLEIELTKTRAEKESLKLKKFTDKFMGRFKALRSKGGAAAAGANKSSDGGGDDEDQPGSRLGLLGGGPAALQQIKEELKTKSGDELQTMIQKLLQENSRLKSANGAKTAEMTATLLLESLQELQEKIEVLEDANELLYIAGKDGKV